MGRAANEGPTAGMPSTKSASAYGGIKKGTGREKPGNGKYEIQTTPAFTRASAILNKYAGH